MLKDSHQYQPEPLFEALGSDFADPVDPADFPQAILRRRNQRWAGRVGLDGLTDEQWITHFARFQPLPGNMRKPLAMRYHGHQFRAYNPQIGDGRGFLFAQLRDDRGRLLDLATKGSGQTPYSRTADGRLTLKGGVREILAAEMLEARGVYTSKAFSLIETGEALYRGDEPSPARSSVLVRLGHSHIRFGTFQRHAAHDRPDLLRILIDHCVEAYYPHLAPLESEARTAAFYRAVIKATAELAASWMAAGFVHGVLNTDNMNVMGESFDYGPWRFLPAADARFTAAYFDEGGLYAFGRQAEAALWNLQRLGGALTLICAEERLEAELQDFSSLYQQAFVHRFFDQLGLTPSGDLEADVQTLSELLRWMGQERLNWDQTMFDLFCAAAGADRLAKSPQARHYASSDFAPIRGRLEALAPVRPERLAHPYFKQERPVSLVIEEVEALWAPIAEHDDWSAFDAKLAAIIQMREAMDIAL